ncbi:hypothetical protein D3C87_1810180 [compost metagenome]
MGHCASSRPVLSGFVHALLLDRSAPIIANKHLIALKGGQSKEPNFVLPLLLETALIWLRDVHEIVIATQQ